MRTLLRLLVLALALVGGSLSAPASAAPPEELSLTLAVTEFRPTSEARTTGKVVHQSFQSRSVPVPSDGRVRGEFVSALECRTVREILRCSVVGTFTGEIVGIGKGTTTSRQHFTCTVGTFDCEGRFVTFRGTGGLAGYRDVGTYVSTPEGLLAVTGRILSR